MTIGLAVYVKIGTGSFPEWATRVNMIAEAGNAVATTLLVVTVSGLRLISPATLSRLVGYSISSLLIPGNDRAR